jgi:Flp pilus assembly protein TadG
VLEAALILPVLIYLGFGTVEFGSYFYIKHAFQGAAREGARAAIVAGATNSDVNSAVASVLAACNMQNSGYTVTTSPSSIGSAAAGTTVSVTVQCAWGKVGISPLGILSANKPVTAVAVMRREPDSGSTGSTASPGTPAPITPAPVTPSPRWTRRWGR